jgi:histidinol dehydrogenase
MYDELNTILISHGQPDFKIRLLELRSAIAREAWFSASDDRRMQVIEILREVERNGAEAISRFTEKFDHVKLQPAQFRVSEQDLDNAYKEIDKDLLNTLRKAIDNVRKYQEEIFIGNLRHPGIKYTPIKSVGICVPGASAPLLSTVIMTAVPAQVAGVQRIVVVSPPRYKGSIHPVILAVCRELGIEEVFRVGGAQAVAALAFGAGDFIRRVDKIVGPGNQWVQTAKREVFGIVGIDSIAGPSEVLIIANDKANPAWVAADMLSQAEHDPGSAVVFTDSQETAQRVLNEIKKQVRQLDRAERTIECLRKYAAIAVFQNMEDVIREANDFASEHLEIQCGDDSKKIAEEIINAGAIFIGGYTPVAVGDYWAGPSHTLPTGTTARFFSVLTANDFIKSTSIIEYSKEQLAKSADDIVRLAGAEGLDAHAKSIRIRQKD